MNAPSQQGQLIPRIGTGRSVIEGTRSYVDPAPTAVDIAPATERLSERLQREWLDWMIVVPSAANPDGRQSTLSGRPVCGVSGKKMGVEMESTLRGHSSESSTGESSKTRQGPAVLRRALAVVAAASAATGLLTLVLASPVCAACTGGIRADGTVIAFGRDNAHQTDVPLAARGGVIAVSAAGEMALALRYDGTVVAWGDNNSGETNVPAGLAGVRALAAGGTFGVALVNPTLNKAGGSVVVWGSDATHVLDVPAAAKSGVVSIAAGLGSVFALKSNGTVVAWGSNVNGQTTVPSGLSGVTSISASGQVLALKSDGTVASWGWNNKGQATEPAGLTGVTAVSAGFTFSLALGSGGSLRAWGDNTSGQLDVPCQIYSPLGKGCAKAASGFTAIAAGDRHALALKNGQITGWGDNTYGQLTLPYAWDSFTAIAAGSDFSLVLYGLPSLPTAPLNVTAYAGDKSAKIAFIGVCLVTNGAPLESYTIRASSGQTWAVSPDVGPDGWVTNIVTGLTNGVTYTFTVSTTTGYGTGPASDPSGPVTPGAGKVFSLTRPEGSGRTRPTFVIEGLDELVEALRVA